MTAIVVDVAGVKAATRRLSSLQVDLAFARSRVDASRRQLQVHADDRGIAAVPTTLDGIVHRLGVVTATLRDDERQTNGFLQRAIELDGRSGRAHRHSVLGAWWRRLRTSASSKLESARVRLIRSARIGWSSINRLGRIGVSLLRRSGSFVHHKVDQWKHSVTTTAKHIVVNGWRRVTSWATRTWKSVTGFFTKIWNAAYVAIRKLIQVIVDIAPETIWLVGSLIAKLVTRPRKTSQEVIRWLMNTVGPKQPLSPEQQAGRDGVLSFIGALSDGSVLPQNHIMVTRVGDRFVVTLPGVEDLSEGFDIVKRDKNVEAAFNKWMESQPTGSPRDLSVAWKAFLLDSNHYSVVVRAVLRRSGIPPGSEIMLIGHSHGAYTAIDLAASPDFNNSSGASGSYRVTHVLAMGAATAVEANKIKPPTQKLIANNAFDLANTAEEFGTMHRRKLPESGADEVWFIGGTAGLGHDPMNYADYFRNNPQDPETRAFLESVGGSYPDARASADDSRVLIPQAQDAPAYDPNANTA